MTGSGPPLRPTSGPAPGSALGQRRIPDPRRINRRLDEATPDIGERLKPWGRAAGRALLAFGRRLLLVAVLGAAAFGVERAARAVVASKRFAVHRFEVSPTVHVSREDIVAATGVAVRAPLLSVDTDLVAAAVARHPWVASARVRRLIPDALAIEVTERRPAATALMGLLYLVDDGGRPFKPATPAEADGLPILTGIGRERYGTQREASEAAFREAIVLATEYGLDSRRPPLTEVNIDAGSGYTLFLLENVVEIRLGRGPFGPKLARLDTLLRELGDAGLGAARVVHLDDDRPDRVTVSMARAEK